MNHKKIGIAMSGGVDSTATALLMQQQAEEVQGFFMKLAQPDYEQQLQRVTTLAKTLNIPLTIIDLTQEFEEKVLHYFSKSYFKGLTPNPCVICNKEIKFGLFQEAILNHNVDAIATGHYAKIVQAGNFYQLHKGVDPIKDQSYFLSRLTQDQLQRTIFPLGGMKKSQIYELVEQHGFMDFRGIESQDVCFLEQDNVAGFLENRHDCNEMSGSIILRNGKILGKHKGLHRYTVGQRKGLGVSYHCPLYVIELDTTTNSVIVGTNDELMSSRVRVEDVHFLINSLQDADTLPNVTVRLRSTHRGAQASLTQQDNNCATIAFNEPQRAITPGQFAVFYHDEMVLGSGVICRR